MKIIIKHVIFIGSLVFSLNTYADSSDRDPTIGGVEFERSCAICHGFNAKGKGVMSDSLTKKPADLTILTKNNNGHFPFSEVYRVIDGSPRVGIHGSREMPIWGDRYRKEAEEYNETAGKYHEITGQTAINEYLHARGLILELLTYIMSIQEE
ncbi:MAG: cytochrome c [Gammaproteobacteria bacterium]|nr:cytochrome c [Gammaproteobacteria bacterium]